MPFFLVFCFHKKCQIKNTFLYSTIESFCCCFSVIRYDPAGVTLCARETLTACASSDCLQMIQKLCFYLIWGSVWFYSSPECIDLSEALGSSEFCAVISCVDSVLRSQSFCFANTHFSPSHITTSVYRHDFSELNTLRCRILLVSRTK